MRCIRRLHIEHLLALARIRNAFVLRHHKSATLRAANEELAATLVAEHRDKIGLLLQVNEQADRLAVSTAAWKLRRFHRVEPAIACKHETLGSVLGGKRKAQTVVR